ncbi:MAG: hypothetical protein WD708_02495 [Kiritimatiellia bacterium]
MRVFRLRFASVFAPLRRDKTLGQDAVTCLRGLQTSKINNQQSTIVHLNLEEDWKHGGLTIDDI